MVLLNIDYIIYYYNLLYFQLLALKVKADLEHETEDEAIGSEVRGITAIKIDVIFSDIAFNIKLAIEVIT